MSDKVTIDDYFKIIGQIAIDISTLESLLRNFIGKFIGEDLVG